MGEYNFPIPGSPDEDKIIIFARRHWASYLGQFFLSVFLLVFPIVIIAAAYRLSSNIFNGIALHFWTIGLSMYYLIVLNFIFVAWITFYYDVYILCRDEIIDIHQIGFFGRTTTQISMLRVQDVSSQVKGIFPTLFGYGNVIVETAGENTAGDYNPEYLIAAIPRPQEFAAKVMQIHNEVIQKQNLDRPTGQGEGTIPPGSVNRNGHNNNCNEAPKTQYQQMIEKDKDEMNYTYQSSEDNSTTDKPMSSSWDRKEKANDDEVEANALRFPENAPENGKPVVHDTPSAEVQSATKEEGEISQEELDKGGEIKLK